MSSQLSLGITRKSQSTTCWTSSKRDQTTTKPITAWKRSIRSPSSHFKAPTMRDYGSRPISSWLGCGSTDDSIQSLSTKYANFTKPVNERMVQTTPAKVPTPSRYMPWKFKCTPRRGTTSASRSVIFHMVRAPLTKSIRLYTTEP